MKLTVDEMVDLNNRINKTAQQQYEKGVNDEKSRALPNNLFDALIEYGKKTKTLIDYHKSASESDGCNWIQLKPTREGEKGTKYVEISFDENLTEVHHIGIGKE